MDGKHIKDNRKNNISSKGHKEIMKSHMKLLDYSLFHIEIENIWYCLLSYHNRRRNCNICPIGIYWCPFFLDGGFHIAESFPGCIVGCISVAKNKLLSPYFENIMSIFSNKWWDHKHYPWTAAEADRGDGVGTFVPLVSSSKMVSKCKHDR